jgi:tricorn protease
VTVDPDGLISRIAVLPITAASYRDLHSVGSQLFYIRAGSKDEKAQLLSYDLDKQKETELGEANGFEISADGKKMLVGQNQSYAIIDLPSAKIDLKDRLNLSDMKVCSTGKPNGNRSSTNAGDRCAISCLTPICTVSTGAP